MGAQPPQVGHDEGLAYFRAIEDAFAALRGTVWVFLSKDYWLAQEWWRAGVPLAAVMAALAEVFARARERDADPPSSLSYCRHAVRRHAKRLAAAHAGGPADALEVPVGPALARLAAEIRKVATAWREQPPVVGVLERLATAVESVPAAAPPAAVQATLDDLEQGAIESLLKAMADGDRKELVQQVEGTPVSGEIAPEVAARSRRALLARAVRERIGLPRLELEHA